MSIARIDGRGIHHEDSGGDGPPVPFLVGGEVRSDILAVPKP